jgi:hypothetical protein
MAGPETSPRDTSPRRQDVPAFTGRVATRPIPPMQVVTKGWFTLREERVPVEELEKEDRDERRQA